MPYKVTEQPAQPVPADGITTRSFHVDYTRAKDGKVFPYLVDLYSKGPNPHGYEATRRDETVADGNEYFSTGELHFDQNDLSDYDGTFHLPKCVCATLRHLGYVVSEDCLASPLV